MKKVLSFVILFALVFSLAGCNSNISNDSSTNTSNYVIDYTDASSFENALNDDMNVKGKVVQFYVNEYVPDSILGINCHAGEHLNFLFENELDVEKGDTIIARITEEPSKVFLLGSWKVPCEFIEITEQKEENSTADKDSNDNISTENNTTETITTATKTESKWQANFSDELVAEIESAFAQIGENPKNIINITYLKTRSTGYVFEQKDYKVEFSWSLGNPGYKHSRYYRITTQNYFEGEPEKVDYPNEFLATIKCWAGDDGYGTNINQWSWTGNGEKQ